LVQKSATLSGVMTAATRAISALAELLIYCTSVASAHLGWTYT